MKENSLRFLPEGIRAEITEIYGEEHMKRRLKDIGFVCGAYTEALYKNGSMRAYMIKGAVIALRDEDAENIEIKKVALYD